MNVASDPEAQLLDLVDKRANWLPLHALKFYDVATNCMNEDRDKRFTSSVAVDKLANIGQK